MTLKTRIFLDRICFFLQNTCDVATGRSRDKEWGPFCAFLEVRTCTCSEWHPPETWTSSPPVSGKPRSSSGRQGTAACHPLGSSPSSLVVSPPPPFQICVQPQWNLKLTAKGLVVYIILSRGLKQENWLLARALLCSVVSWQGSKRRGENRTATFHPQSWVVHLIYTQK